MSTTVKRPSSPGEAFDRPAKAPRQQASYAAAPSFDSMFGAIAHVPTPIGDVRQGDPLDLFLGAKPPTSQFKVGDVVKLQ